MMAKPRAQYRRWLLACAIAPGCLEISMGCAAPKREKTIQEAGKQRWDDYRAAVKFELASAEMQKGNTDEALTLAQEVESLSPSRPDHVELLAKAHLAKGDFGAARGILEAACRVHVNEARLHYLLGTVYERERQWEPALTEFRIAAAAQPGKLDYLVALAQAVSQVSGTAAAITLLDKSAPQFENEALFQVTRAEAFRSGGDLARAAEAYRRAVHLGASDRTTREAAGMCLFWLGQFEEARDTLAALVVSEKTADAALVIAYARCLLALGEHRSAAELLEKRTMTQPDHAGLWMLLAEIHMQAGSTAEAIAAARRAVALEPRNCGAQMLVASMQLLVGDLDAAAAAACKAVDSSPDNSDAYLLLGRVYEHRKDSRTAGEMYRTALRVEPGNRMAGELLKRVTSHE